MNGIFRCVAVAILTTSLSAQVPVEGPEVLPAAKEGVSAQTVKASAEDGRQNAASLPPGAVRTEGAADEGSDLVLRTPDGVERMRILSSGNVGIGTSTPDRALVVNRTGVSNYLKVLGGSGAYDIADWWTDGTNHVFAGNMRASTGLTGAFTVWTGGVARMNVLSDGNVGIGTASPNRKLYVLSQTNGVDALFAQTTGTHSANTTAYDFAAMAQSYQNISAGATNSGVSTAQRATAILTGGGTLANVYALRADVNVDPGQAGVITNAYGIYSRVTRNQGTITNGYVLYLGNAEATSDWGLYQAAADDDNYFAGNVRIGTTSSPTNAKLEVAGNLNVSGSITGATVIGATYQDVAEWVPATVDMEPGTVVVLNRDRSNEVMPSHRAYDTGVAGVVSGQPGILLGVHGESKEQIATTGRVRVRVDARQAPIRVGDLLVTSDNPGTAMRSEPIEVQGRTFHQPGTIIGKALEPLDSGLGEILVLLSLQ